MGKGVDQFTYASASGNIKSNNLQDMINAQMLGLTLEQYLAKYKSASQWEERTNIERPINPKKQWGNQDQQTRKDQVAVHFSSNRWK